VKYFLTLLVQAHHTSAMSEVPFLCTYGRKMFTTEDRYVGLGPKNMQRGDCIASLEGGHVPYILRQVGERFELIGDCYIHGVMQGEWLDQTRSERIWLI